MEFKDLWDYLNTLETFEELNESKFSIKGEKSHNKHLDKNKRDYQTKENGSRFHNITFDQYNENGDILSKKSVKTSDINSKDRFIQTPTSKSQHRAGTARINAFGDLTSTPLLRSDEKSSR